MSTDHYDQAERFFVKHYQRSVWCIVGTIPPPAGPDGQQTIADHYAVLGVLPTAPIEEIHKAYRKLVLLHHPDKVAAPERGSRATTPKNDQYSDVTISLNDVTDPSSRQASASVDIRALNEAKYVLSDLVRRADYDAALQNQPPRREQVVSDDGPHISREVSLEQFEPRILDAEQHQHPAARADAERGTPLEAEELEPDYWTYPCRCSATFTITREQLEDGVDVIGCPGCGEWIKVLYEEVEE